MRGSSLLTLAGALLAACPSVNPQTPALVEYQRSGGIAGQTIRLVVQGDGSAQLYGRIDTTNVTVPQDTLERLKHVIEGINFDTLRAEYQPPPTERGADRFEYVVACRGRRVKMQDGAVPADLQPLIDLLNGVVRRRG